MKVHLVEPNLDTAPLLPGARFGDAYSVALDEAALTARQAAERMLGRGPRWIDLLLTLRNVLAAPFGLKTGTPSAIAASDRIGIFPVVSQTPDRLVAGFDDKHLDFRLVVDVARAGRGQRVTAISPAGRPQPAAASRGLRARPPDLVVESTGLTRLMLA